MASTATFSPVQTRWAGLLAPGPGRHLLNVLAQVAQQTWDNVQMVTKAWGREPILFLCLGL